MSAYKFFAIISAICAVAFVILVGPVPVWGMSSFAIAVISGIIATFLWEVSEDNPNVRW